MFAERLLRDRGFKGEFRRLASPVGRGDAKKYVLESVAKEAHAIRSRAAQGFLIVMIDADEGTVDRRLAEVDAKLRESGQETLAGGARVECWVPKRNVETWLMCLLDQLCSEEEDYKRDFDHRHRAQEGDAIRRAISLLHEQASEQVNPPSLRRVVSESTALRSD
jgi:hypothetical protein